MQQDIHPEYRDVVFHDSGANVNFITRSTMKTKDTIELDGKTYPVVNIDISSASHPFYTGKMKYVDSAGRVEKFQRKYGWDKRGKGDKGDAGEEKKSESSAEE